MSMPTRMYVYVCHILSAVLLAFSTLGVGFKHSLESGPKIWIEFWVVEEEFLIERAMAKN